MRTVVTGAAGFVGSQLVEKLLARGDDVVCIERTGGRPGCTSTALEACPCRAGIGHSVPQPVQPPLPSASTARSQTNHQSNLSRRSYAKLDIST